MVCCKEPYYPPIPGNHQFLVVDGFLNASQDSTYITLSRTRNFGDSVSKIPELNAQVMVLGELGETLPLIPISGGRYVSENLNLVPSEKYQLEIITQNGKKYLSDTIPVVISPPIDSLSWSYDSLSAEILRGVTIKVNTHDPLNHTFYYRWEFLETWEYNADFDAFYTYENGLVVPRQPAEHTFSCWKTLPSETLLLATTDHLSQDIVAGFPLQFIPQNDEKLSIGYSMQVKQYALTKTAYDYWVNLKKNTELTGSVFDPAPSQLTGNLHSLDDPTEPVLGYISSSSVQQKRNFISTYDLGYWNYTLPQGCFLKVVTADSVNFWFGSSGYEHFVPVSPKGLFDWWGAHPECVDCTEKGGVALKPSFWP